MAFLRTFLAVELDPAIQTQLLSLQETLARSGEEVKWVGEDNLHLTMLFLGDVDEREIHKVCRAVGEVCAKTPAFHLSVEKVGAFPNLNRPRTIWAGILRGQAELVKLHADLEAPLVQMGLYRREERKFTPHITIGRVKGDKPMEGLTKALTKQANWCGGECEVAEVLVMSSQLTPQGPIYSILSTAELA